MIYRHVYFRFLEAIIETLFLLFEMIISIVTGVASQTEGAYTSGGYPAAIFSGYLWKAKFTNMFSIFYI